MANSNRQFRKCGKSFLVSDTLPQDRKSDKDKYYLTVKVNGMYKIVYDNITWEIPKFPTIRAAHFWALMNTDFIGTM